MSPILVKVFKEIHLPIGQPGFDFEKIIEEFFVFKGHHVWSRKMLSQLILPVA